jgi:hypothetical protein
VARDQRRGQRPLPRGFDCCCCSQWQRYGCDQGERRTQEPLLQPYWTFDPAGSAPRRLVRRCSDTCATQTSIETIQCLLGIVGVAVHSFVNVFGEQCPSEQAPRRTSHAADLSSQVEHADTNKRLLWQEIYALRRRLQSLEGIITILCLIVLLLTSQLATMPRPASLPTSQSTATVPKWTPLLTVRAFHTSCAKSWRNRHRHRRLRNATVPLQSHRWDREKADIAFN